MRDLLSTFGVRIINLMEMCFCGAGGRRVTEGEKLTWYKGICSQIVRKKFLIELMKYQFAVWLLIFDKNTFKTSTHSLCNSNHMFRPNRPSPDQVHQI